MKRKGFTLVELLVVISIIALLLGILLPSLSKAREMAKIVVCKSNLKQLTVATIMYAQDNKGWAPPIKHDAGEYYFYKVANYLGDSNYQKLAKEGREIPENALKVMYCPNATRISTHPLGGGSATEAWIWGTASGSYGMNLWASQWEGAEIQMAQENYLGRITMVGSEAPLYGDCNWVGGWPQHYEIPVNLRQGSLPDERNRNMPRFCIDRHNMKVNIANIDGSVNTFRLEELWRLKWHKNFDTNFMREDFLLKKLRELK